MVPDIETHCTETILIQLMCYQNILGLSVYLISGFLYFSTDSSIEDASILDDNGTRNGESDDGLLHLQPGGRQLITELPSSR